MPSSLSIRRCAQLVGLVWTSVLVGLLACTALAQPAGDTPSQVYRLKYRSVAEVERPLNEVLARLGVQTQITLDTANNQLMLRGPQQAQAVAQQYLANLDRPANETVSGEPTLRTHACLPGRQAEAAERLRALYAGRSDLRISPDPNNPQLYVFAPPALQAEVASYLASSGLAPGGGPAGAARPATPTAPATNGPGVSAPVVQASAPVAKPISPIVPPVAPPAVPPAVPPVLQPEAATTGIHSVALQNVRLEQVEALLSRWLGQRWVATSAAPGTGQPAYVYTDNSARRVEVFVDRNRNQIGFRGPDALVRQFDRLIANVDQPVQAGQTQRVLPVRKADPSKVEEAVRAYREGTTRPTPDESSNDRLPNGQIDLVGYLFQQTPEPNARASRAAAARAAAAAKAAGKTAEPIPAQEPLDEAVQRKLRALGSEVEVEVLPDLDVIILRGREQDVDDVSRIVEELERISVEAQPSIEVYPLKNAGSEALTALVARVSDAVVGGRQGRVSVMPLSKPNAILLIGWGEALVAMRELIDKLDQPVAPDTQFQVFPLQHAPANALRTTVQEHFANRVGLNGRVQVSADARTNSLIVQAPPREMAEVVALVQDLDRNQSAAVNQTRLFRLMHSMAVDLATTLQAAIDISRGTTPSSAAAAAGQKSAVLELLTLDQQGQRLVKSGILADVRITPDPRLNTILVTGPAESMDLIAALIQQLDQPVSAAQIKVFRILNGDASSLVNMLRALLFRTDTSGGPQLSVNPQDDSLAPLRFSVDTRTNSIIAVGSVGDLRIIEALLLRLDEQEMQRRRNAVYRLKNAPAMDVATAINEFLRSRRQVAQALPGVVSPYEIIESEVVVVPEVVSNSLVLSASPRFFDEVNELIEKLDAEPPKVLIQVLIAQIDLSNFHEFGVELGIQDSVLFDRSVLSNVTQSSGNVITSTLVPGTNFVGQALGSSGPNAASSGINYNSVGGQATSSFNLGRANTDLDYGGLVLAASSENISVLIRALEDSRCLEVLSRPQVMTLDNQPAYIQVGQRVPRIQGTAVNVNGSVNSVVLENVGLILAVTPRTSPDGMVVMEVDAEKSEVGAEADGIPVSVSNSTVIRSPKINVTTAQTTVSAASGETVVLGGLITKSTQTVERKLPWVGDLPIVGNLFKYNSKKVARSELLIVLSPHVVRSREDMDRARQIEAARMHWCMRDIHQMHGDIGVEDGRNQPAGDGAPVVYPDRNPRGVLPEEARPQGDPHLRPIPEELPRPAGQPGAIQWPARPGSLPGGESSAGRPNAPMPGPTIQMESRNPPWQEEWNPPGMQRGQFNAVAPVGYTAPSDEAVDKRRRAAAVSGQLQRVEDL